MNLKIRNLIWGIIGMIGVQPVAFALEADLGIRAGLNVHTVTFDATRNASQSTAGSNVNFGLGLAGGVGTELHFTDLLSIETNLMWVTRGFVLSSTTNAIETNIRSSYNTVAVPILAKFSFGTWDFIPYFGVGLEPYYIISAGETRTETNQSATTSTISLTNLNQLNVGVAGVLGFTYFWGDVGFNLDVRYTYTLTNIDSTGGTNSLRNQDIITLFGAIFRL
jgi:hypothetical protein